MGFIFGLLRKILKLIIYFAIFASLIVLIPNLPPYTTFTKIDLEPPQPYVGALAPNEVLNNPEKLYLDKVLGPEAFQIYKGEVYTSVATGEIVKLSPGGHVTFVTKIGQPCTGIKEEHICGRILGFVIDEKKNQMYVADAYLGIWKVDLNTDKKELLVSPRTAIKGKYPKLFNSVALDGNGNLYWAHSTTDFDLKDGAYAMLTDPTGRLLQYNAATNHSTVLLDNIWFANGLAVSPDNQFVVVASTCSFKLQKYYINGPKKGKTEDFVVGLPGTPDNVRALPDGSGVLVALYTLHAPHEPLLTRALAPVPAARKLLARAQRLVELAAESLHNLYPHALFEDIVYNIGHFKTTNALLPKTSALLQIDWDGGIVASYYHTQGQIHLSDAVVFGDRLYLGQPHSQNYVGSVPAPPQLKKAFSANVQQKAQEKKEVPKAQPPKATPKPKQVEPVKIATPKPAEAKPQVVTPKPTPPPPKPTAAPVKVEKKEAPAPPKVEVKKETPKPITAAPPRTTSKPATKTETVPTTTPKPVEKTTKAPSPSAAPAKPAQEVKPKPIVAQNTETKPPSKSAPGKGATEPPAAKPVEKNQAKPDSPKAKAETKTKPTPIIEEIPSDTIKPNKDTLKVIKKEGPTEIPNPNL